MVEGPTPEVHELVGVIIILILLVKGAAMKTDESVVILMLNGR